MMTKITPSREKEILASCGPFAAYRWGMIGKEGATFDEWQRAGQFFAEMREAASWALCDWLAYGEAHFGEDYAQALDEMEFSEGYLANLHTLYRAFPPGTRRWPLGKTYYQAVLPLVPAARERILDMVVAQRLSRDEVRQLVAAQPDEERRHKRPVRQVADTQVPSWQDDSCLVALPGPDTPPGSDDASEAIWTDTFCTHDRADGAIEPGALPSPLIKAGLAAVGPQMLGAAKVEVSYGRQIGFLFETVPDLDLHEGQRVRVYVEVVK